MTVTASPCNENEKPPLYKGGKARSAGGDCFQCHSELAEESVCVQDSSVALRMTFLRENKDLSENREVFSRKKSAVHKISSGGEHGQIFRYGRVPRAGERIAHRGACVPSRAVFGALFHARQTGARAHRRGERYASFFLYV